MKRNNIPSLEQRVHELRLIFLLRGRKQLSLPLCSHYRAPETGPPLFSCCKSVLLTLNEDIWMPLLWLDKIFQELLTGGCLTCFTIPVLVVLHLVFDEL